MELTDDGQALLLRVGDTELLRYVYRPPEPQVESPRPYLHPVRTLAGDVVSIYRPHDHVWHKGISWSLPNVGPANFWGGPTFVRDEGYRQLPNNGAMRHVSFTELASDGTSATVRHTLEWITEQGEKWFDEDRTLRMSLVDGGWLLDFATACTNVSGAPVAMGSPTTEGRPNAGYGGLMWRGPRSFSGGRVVLPDAEGGDDLMGSRAPWLAFRGRHDGHGGSSTLVFLDAPANPGHPTRWFVRSEPFACVCPAPFFAEEVPVAAGGTLALRYGVVVADGTPNPAALAATGLSALDGGS